MAQNVIILSSKPPATFGTNVAKIARHLGIPISFQHTFSSGMADSQELVMVASGDALSAAAGRPAEWRRTVPGLLRRIKALFVYGWNGSEASNEFLNELTAGSVLRAITNRRSVHRIAVACDSQDFSGPLAGLDFEMVDGSGGAGFMPGEGAPAPGYSFTATKTPASSN